MPKASTPRAWQRMLSGRRLDLLDPSPFDVEISDIAHGLARVARWNGQTTGDHAFSVAQHSVLVVDILRSMQPEAEPDLLLAALLHDAPEYVIGDMISPFKSVLGDGYGVVESRLMTAIYLRFGLPAHLSAGVKKTIKLADRVSAHREAVDLAGFSEAEAKKLFPLPKGVAPHQNRLVPQPAVAAQASFLAAFRALSP